MGRVTIGNKLLYYHLACYLLILIREREWVVEFIHDFFLVSLLGENISLVLVGVSDSDIVIP